MKGESGEERQYICIILKVPTLDMCICCFRRRGFGVGDAMFARLKREENRNGTDE